MSLMHKARKFFSSNKKEIVVAKNKIFCVGLNKTGTTSLERALVDLGYKPGDQISGELLIDSWIKRDFNPIIDLCKSAEFFQDAPFSFPFTFAHLDMAFPDSKFILTVRSNPEQWYKSITRFHGKLWSKEGKIPTAEDLKNAEYRYKGYAYHALKHAFMTDDADMYNKEKLLSYYEAHNKNVIDYFSFSTEKLLVVDLSEDMAYQKVCDFLGVKPLYNVFPWLNKS